MRSLGSAAATSPSAVEPRGSGDPDLGTDRAKARPILRAGVLAIGVGLLAFLLIQGLLAAYNVHIVRDAISRGLIRGYPSIFSSLRVRLLSTLVGGGITYLIVALVGMAIASRGHRLLFMLPAASYVLVTVAVGYVHQPQAIGDQWRLQCFRDVCNPWFAHPWLGPFVDLALVLLPGWIVAMRVGKRRWAGVVDASAIASVLLIVALVALAGWTMAVIDSSFDPRALVAVGTLGIVIGTARPWWPWLHVLFASLVAGPLVWFVSLSYRPDPYISTSEAAIYVAQVTWPIVAVGLLASGWQPLAWLLRRLEDRPLRLLVSVNVLNVVDAVLTSVAVRSGGALEANTVVRLGGLPAKVILVGVLTGLLYRRRPASLVWAATALLWVACYHVSGILVNGWRTG